MRTFRVSFGEVVPMPKAPIGWREMERKVREIEARVMAILARPRLPQPIKDHALAILALAAEILRRSNGD